MLLIFAVKIVSFLIAVLVNYIDGIDKAINCHQISVPVHGWVKIVIVVHYLLAAVNSWIFAHTFYWFELTILERKSMEHRTGIKSQTHIVPMVTGKIHLSGMSKQQTCVR